jgi:hypothetical protein
MNPDLIALRGAVAVPRDPLRYVSGFDASPIFEEVQGDDQVPPVWDLSTGHVALLDLGEEPVTVAGPGGAELVRGAEDAAEITLRPGEGQVWAP